MLHTQQENVIYLSAIIELSPCIGGSIETI